MKMDKFKLLGLGASVLGMVATLVSNYAGDKNLDSKIAQEVAKALAKKEN